MTEGFLRIAIVGSRTFPLPELVARYVAKLPEGSVVVSGAARGVDTWAEEAAKARGIKTLVFHADWDGLGSRAGPIRNKQIIANCDRVVAFWSGNSRGTLNTVVQATRAGLPVEIFGPEGQPIDVAVALEAAERLGVIASIKSGKARLP
jgi:predicted Rossmann fold nucleotide-binding protein DprA/Smf involved in DNA uptake